MVVVVVVVVVVAAVVVVGGGMAGRGTCHKPASDCGPARDMTLMQHVTPQSLFLGEGGLGTCGSWLFLST